LKNENENENGKNDKNGDQKWGQATLVTPLSFLYSFDSHSLKHNVIYIPKGQV
jgi:hypothetical protein